MAYGFGSSMAACRTAEICLDIDRPARRIPERGGCFAASFRAAADQEHIGSVRRQQRCCRKSDPGRPSRNNSRPSIHSV